MIARKLRVEEYPAVNALFAVAFETTPENGPARAEDGLVRHWGVFSEDGQLMSSLSTTPFSMRFDGAACPMAGIGAVLHIGSYFQASPMMGSMLGLKAFVAAVLGGIGSIPGAMIGGFVIGLAEALVSAIGLSVWQDAVVFAILIIVLLVKPTGIMGHPMQEKV